MSVWYMIVFFAGSVEIHRIDGGKPACDALRAEVMSGYGKGSALVDVRCVVIQDNSPNRKPTT